MALDIPTGYAHVIHSLVLNGDPDPMSVTYGIELQPDVPLTPNVVAQDLHDNFGQQWASTLGAPYTLRATEIRYPTDAGGAFGIGVHVANIPMANAGSFLPQNSAFLLHKRSGLGGRKNRGRMYLPGVNDVLVDDKGLMSGTAVNGVNAAADLFLLGIAATVGVERMVILHTKPIGPVVDVPTPVTTLLLDPILATQRRRLR